MAGDIVGDFFEKDWIDAAVRPGKMLGAFCATLVPDVHPYVLMNYAGERRSVLTLAHELGHGLHGSLAQDLGLLNARTPLTLAETASVFGEALTFERLMEREDDPRARLDSARRPHRRRDLDRLPPDRAQPLRARDPHRAAARRASCPSSGSPSSGRRSRGGCSATPSRSPTTTGSGGATCPHFIAVPGYVYAYSFGYLFSLAIYRRYLDEGESLVEPYLDLLRAGGSAPPAELASRLGFDIGDPGFWAAGLDAIGDARRRGRAARRRARRRQVTDCYLAGSGVLVVAATGRELVPRSTRARDARLRDRPGRRRRATARAIAEERPRAVLHVGIAGARGLEPLTLVLGSEALYCDAAGPLVAARAFPDAGLLAPSARRLSRRARGADRDERARRRLARRGRRGDGGLRSPPRV